MNPQLTFLLGSTSGDMFSLNLQTVIQMLPNLASVILLACIMSALLYNPVRNALKNRNERIAGELKEAAENRASANTLRQEYEKKIKDIELEKGIILDEARKQANEKRTQLLEEAKVEVQEVKDRAAKDIASERDRIKDEVHRAIIDISSDIAAKLISATIDQNAHDRLFAEALVELESTAFRPAEESISI